jgi:hypothetical protein
LQHLDCSEQGKRTAKVILAQDTWNDEYAELCLEKRRDEARQACFYSEFAPYGNRIDNNGCDPYVYPTHSPV